MIDIKKNSINKISIDIDQYEYYLIEFTSDSNCESVTAIFSNYGFNCDYPIIKIEETVTANINVLLGKINLPYLGFWSANIYGNIDGVNLDTGLATFLIEEDARVYKGVQEEYAVGNYLTQENNLSDVDDVTTSQNNLNVYDKTVTYTQTEVNDLIDSETTLLIEDKTTAFNTTTLKNNALYRFDKATDDNATILWNSVTQVGKSIYFEQVGVGLLSYVAGAGVTIIGNLADSKSTIGERDEGCLTCVAMDTLANTATYKES